MANTTLNQSAEASTVRSGWYDPASPEVQERRRQLFDDIARGRTSETDAAMEKVYQMYLDEDRE